MRVVMYPAASKTPGIQSYESPIITPILLVCVCMFQLYFTNCGNSKPFNFYIRGSVHISIFTTRNVTVTFGGWAWGGGGGLES